MKTYFDKRKKRFFSSELASVRKMDIDMYGIALCFEYSARDQRIFAFTSDIYRAMRWLEGNHVDTPNRFAVLGVDL